MSTRRPTLAAALLIASAGAAPALITPPAPAQIVYHEVEPNDTKAEANVIDGGGLGMFPGDMIVGETRCTYPCGVWGPDFFLITTAPAPIGVYRYQLAAAPGSYGSVLGTYITNCQVVGDDVLWSQAYQSPVAGEWYGFGKRERVYWEIAGGGIYSVTLQRDEVPRLATLGPFRPGPIRIDSGGGYGLRVFAYDAHFNAIPGDSGCACYSTLTWTFSAGTYHLALASWNEAENNLPCPAGQLLSGRATDFPDCLVSDSFRVGSPGASLRIRDSQDRAAIVQTLAQFAVEWVTVHVYDQGSCGSADFDGDGAPGTSQDIEAFFACLAGDCCVTCDPHGADFNGDGDTATDADIEAFFRVLAGGSC